MKASIKNKRIRSTNNKPYYYQWEIGDVNDFINLNILINNGIELTNSLL